MRSLITITTAFFLVSCSFFEPDYKKLETFVDTSQKHPNDKRKVKALTLDNKLDVLLLSDPNLKQSAAAMDVNVGFMEDPKGQYGKAHFLEHMLFIGTKKYPDVGGYNDHLAKYQGYSNAWTFYEHTNYRFEVNHEGFDEAFDRFAQFFVAPLFDPKFVEREKNAVHSEYQNRMQSDNAHFHAVNRSTMRQDHPIAQFSIGSKETLKSISRESLIEFYDKNYSANLMKLVVLSNKPIAEMEKQVRETFSKVKNQDFERRTYSPELHKKGTLPLKHHIKPVKDLRRLGMLFSVPEGFSHYKTKPEELISFLIGHQGEGSLLSMLKEKELATEIGAWNFSNSFVGTLGIYMDLTEKGLENYDQVLELFFAYINLIKKEGFPRHIYSENKVMSDLGFVYREHIEGGDYVSNLANLMQYYPADQVLEHAFLFHEYRPEDVQKYLEAITPEQAKVFVTHQSLETDQVEEYFGAQYKTHKLDKEWVKKMKAATAPQGLHLPEPNPFIPESMEIHSDEKSKEPQKVVDTPGVEMWFQQDQDFILPKAYVVFDVLGMPAINEGQGHLMRALYLRALSESLNEWRFLVTQAGLSFSLSYSRVGVSISIDGYSDKMMKLSEELFNRLKQLTLDAKRFEQIKEELLRDLRNQDFDMAFRQLAGARDFLFYRHGVDLRQFKEDIAAVTLDQVKAYTNRLYQKGKIRGLAYGNLKRKPVIETAKKLTKALGIQAPSAEEQGKLLKDDVVDFPKGKIWQYRYPSQSDNNAWLGYVEFGPRSPKSTSMVRLLDSHLGHRFFEEIRTNQQTGYVVMMRSHSNPKSRGVQFIVQSADYPLKEILRRSDAFIAKELKALDEITEETFATYVKGLITVLEQPDKRMSERFSRLADEALNLNGQFNHKKDVIAFLKALTREDFIQEVRKAFSKDGIQRIDALLAKEGGAYPSLSGREMIPTIPQWKEGQKVHP